MPGRPGLIGEAFSYGESFEDAPADPGQKRLDHTGFVVVKDHQIHQGQQHQGRDG